MSIFFFYFFMSQVIWGVVPVFWKYLYMLDPVYLLCVRIVWSTIVCGIWCFATTKARRAEGIALFRNRPLMKRLLAASIFITMNWGLYIYAVTGGHILDAALAYYINPILCLLFSALLFKEKMNAWQKSAILVAASGIITAFLLYGQMPWLSLIMCFPFAIYSCIKKGVRASGLLTVFFESLCVTVPALFYILYMDGMGAGAAGHVSGWEWLLLPMTGVITALPMAFFSAGLQGISFSAASIMMYLGPSFQMGTAFLYGEHLSPIMLINFLFVIIAVALYVTGNLRAAARLKKDIETPPPEGK